MVRTALFGDNDLFHFHQYCRGFARYWYQYHLAQRGFYIEMLTANVDWGTKLRQKITRLGGLERQSDNWVWPFCLCLCAVGLGLFQTAQQQAG